MTYDSGGMKVKTAQWRPLGEVVEGFSFHGVALGILLVFLSTDGFLTISLRRCEISFRSQSPSAWGAGEGN